MTNQYIYLVISTSQSRDFNCQHSGSWRDTCHGMSALLDVSVAAMVKCFACVLNLEYPEPLNPTRMLRWVHCIFSVSCGSVTSVQQYYNQHQGKLQPATVTEYTYNHKLQLVKEVNHGCGFYLADVGPNPVEVWYPKGIYLRAPDSLPQAMSRMDLVQFELGAIRR